jgi:hypothetical protein
METTPEKLKKIFNWMDNHYSNYSYYSSAFTELVKRCKEASEQPTAACDAPVRFMDDNDNDVKLLSAFLKSGAYPAPLGAHGRNGDIHAADGKVRSDVEELFSYAAFGYEHGNEPQNLDDWYKFHLIAFTLAKLGWDATDPQESSRKIETTFKSIGRGVANMPPYKRNVMALLADHVKIEISVPSSLLLNDGGKLLEESFLDSAYEQDTAGFQAAGKYVKALIKIVSLRKHSTDCNGEINDRINEATKILNRVATATTPFFQYPPVMIDLIVKTLVDSSLAERIESRVEIQEESLTAFSKLALVQNAAPLRFETNASVKSWQGGTVFEGINSAAVEKLLSSSPKLCVGVQCAMIESNSAGQEVDRAGAAGRLQRFFESRMKATADYSINISVVDHGDVFTVKLVFQGDVEKAHAYMFGIATDNGGVLPERSALSAHRYLSYLKIKKSAKQGAYNFDRLLTQKMFEIQAVDVHVLSNVYESADGMPARVSLEQINTAGRSELGRRAADVRGRAKEVATLGGDEFTLGIPVNDILEASLRTLETTDTAELKTTGVTNTTNIFKDRVKKSFQTNNILVLSKMAVLQASNLGFVDDPTAMTSAFTNEMASGLAGIELGDAFPQEDQTLQTLLFAMRTFAHEFENVLNFTAVFADVLDESIWKDRLHQTYNDAARTFQMLITKKTTQEAQRLRLRIGRLHSSLQSYRNWAEASFVSRKHWEDTLQECFSAFRLYSSYRRGPLTAILFACAVSTTGAAADAGTAGFDSTGPLQEVADVTENIRRTVKTMIELYEQNSEFMNSFTLSENQAAWLERAQRNMEFTTGIYARAALIQRENPGTDYARFMGAFYGKDGLPLSPTNVEIEESGMIAVPEEDEFDNDVEPLSP